MIQRFKCIECHKFWDPGVAQLTDIRQGITGIGGEEFLMSRGPGNVLDDHVNTRILCLKACHEFTDTIPFGAKSPEVQSINFCSSAFAAGYTHEHEHKTKGQFGD